MNHHDIIQILNKNDRVTSTYAEIYYENEYCKTVKPKITPKIAKNDKSMRHLSFLYDEDEWISPSDLLIGVIDLKPPFTTKILRGKAHEGLLEIGNSVLENERQRFYKSLKNILYDNDASWEFILQNERKAIHKKVKIIYANIFKQKRDTMTDEISKFYENSLKEIEENLKSEIKIVLESTRASMISNSNIEIQEKLKKEKQILENKLQNKYVAEVKKINEYYTLLLNNELKKYRELRNCMLNERNDALKAYYNQIESERLTSTMYILSLERKKCKIKKMLLEKYQTAEISEKIQKIKEKKVLLDIFKENEVHISKLNEEWETKIKKILQLFLKFIGFSLKLLPEQTTFLLDLEKMVILQLNEIQKNPNVTAPILIDEQEQAKMFKIEAPEEKPSVCNKEPFILIGDLSEPEPPKYESRETLPSDIDLPFFRLQRQYVYAKCHGYEGIKQMLDEENCKCYQRSPKAASPELDGPIQDVLITVATSYASAESSDAKFIIDDFRRYRECPLRNCADWTQRTSFPFLVSYLDFSEENYARVKSILPNVAKTYVAPELMNPKRIAYSELPISATKNVTRTLGTQYSSQESLDICSIPCKCIEDNLEFKQEDPLSLPKSHSDVSVNKILAKRKISLNRMLAEHPKLLELLTDEKYDYKM